MAEESKTGNPITLERQDAEIEGADETIKAERTGPGGDLTELTTTAPKKKNKKVTKGFMGWKIKAAERKKKEAKEKQDKEDKEKREKQLGKKFVERVRAKKLGDQVREEGELTHLKEEKYGKEYENEQWKLNFKINFIIEQIEDLDEELATKLKSGDEGAITQLISIEEGAEPINKLKLKLANCLKELGSMMNLRESKQIQRINEYIKSLKDVNDIFKINQYVNDDDKIPEDMNFEDKICQKDDNTETCKKKLEEALGMFEQFKGKMTKALESQNENETKFQKMKEDGEKFKTDFGKWMEGLNELGNEPIEKLNSLKETIGKYDVNLDLLGDEKDLKANMLNEIGILIKTIGEYKQYEEELKAEKKNMEQAQINLDAAKAVGTKQELDAVEEEEDDKEPEEFGLGETGTDEGQRENDESGTQPVEAAKTDNKPVEVEASTKTDESGTQPVEEVEASKTDNKPVEEVVTETDEAKAARLKHKEFERRKKELLPIERSASEGIIGDPKNTPLKRSDSAPAKNPIMTEGLVPKEVEKLETAKQKQAEIESETAAEKLERLKKEEQRKDETIALKESLPQESQPPPPTGMPTNIEAVDSQKSHQKEVGDGSPSFGGRKKKSRRRKKSKKRKSKKNRR